MFSFYIFSFLLEVFKRTGIELTIENFECLKVTKMAARWEWIKLFTDGSLVCGE